MSCSRDSLILHIQRSDTHEGQIWAQCNAPNHNVYTAVTQYSFLRMHKEGLQPNHLHRCQTVQLYMYAQRWFTTKPFTLLSNSAALHVCTKMVYNQTIYTAVKRCSFTCMHNDGLQPHYLHHCHTVQLSVYAQWWFTTTPFTPLSNSAALHVGTMMVYSHTIYTALLSNCKPFLAWTTMICNHIIYTAVKQQQFYMSAQWCFTTIYTTAKQCNFTGPHRDNLQPHFLHCLSNCTALQADTVMIYNHTIYTAVSLQIYMPAR